MLAAEDILYITSGSIMPASRPAGVTFDCPDEDNQLLLAGSCMNNTLAPDMNIIMSGLFRPPPDAWLCDWFNRAQFPAEVTITATCLELPSAPVDNGECDCLPVEPIQNRIVRSQQAGVLRPTEVASVQASCSNGAALIGGGCRLEFDDIKDEMQLTSSGFDGGDRWKCSWKNPTAESGTGQATALCLQPPPIGTAPENGPIDEWLVQISNSDVIPANNVRLVEASCAPGDLLLWGSCALDSPEPSGHGSYLFRSGFIVPAENEPGTWQCGWNNSGETMPTATATAVCLKRDPM